MKNFKAPIFVIAILFILFFMMGPYFIVQEGELAVVTRFGKIVDSVMDAGLKFKMPFVDNVEKYPKKIQSWDGEAQPIPTSENQLIWVDTTARWKISDPKLFYESVGTIQQANSRLDDVIDSSSRKVIAQNPLRESVRNSNIINEIERTNVFDTQKTPDSANANGKSNIEMISTFTNVKYEEIKKGREALSEAMLKEAMKNTPKYGIELIDIIIRQIKYSDDLTLSVFNRMIKERKQIAQAFRSDGEGEKAKWLGKMEKELRSIRSDAERQAKEIKAKADGEALEIRNIAYNQDTEFAEFWMAMMQYEKLLPNIKKLLTTDLEFFKYLYQKSGK